MAKKCIARAIAAECDQVLPNYRLSFKEVYNYLLDAYHQGIITEERLNEAVHRVLKAQEKAMIKPSSDHLKQEHIDAVEELNKRVFAIWPRMAPPRSFSRQQKGFCAYLRKRIPR